MRNVPSPVTVVTSAGASGPFGVTIGSFTSVSLAPPLISFNIMHSSRIHEALVKSDFFRVHILREDQAALSVRFATPRLTAEAQFEAIPHHLDETGVPKIEGVLASLYCQHFNAVEAGDHTLLIGQVIDVESSNANSGPLLYYKSTYCEVGAEVRAVH